MFIDALHKEEHVFKEFDLVKDIVNPNGLIIFHDSISFDDVVKVVEYAKSLPKFEVITLPTPIIHEMEC